MARRLRFFWFRSRSRGIRTPADRALLKRSGAGTGLDAIWVAQPEISSAPWPVAQRIDLIVLDLVSARNGAGIQHLAR